MKRRWTKHAVPLAIVGCALGARDPSHGGGGYNPDDCVSFVATGGKKPPDNGP